MSEYPKYLYSKSCGIEDFIEIHKDGTLRIISEYAEGMKVESITTPNPNQFNLLVRYNYEPTTKEDFYNALETIKNKLFAK